MSKDSRLYARFDINMDEHPKIFLLSDAAFRALIESTMYSRRQLSDGFIPLALVIRKWGNDVVNELTANDPEKPSWVQCVQNGVDGVMIHDFASHQTTRNDIKAKREAGRKGAAARWNRGEQAEPMAGAMAGAIGDPMRNDATPMAITETETETETKTDKEPSSEVAVATIRPEAKYLLDLLDSLIVANGSKKPSRSKANLDAARLILDKDGRTVEQVEKAIRWCQADSFWKANILSFAKLREKYDQLRLAAQHERADGVTANQARGLSIVEKYREQEVGHAEIANG